MRSCPEEAQTKLIHRAGAESSVIADNELLSAGCRDAGKAWHAGIQRVEVVGVVEVIIKRPVAGHLVNEVHALPSLVILYLALLAGVSEISVTIADRDVGQYLGRRQGKRARWDYAARKHTLGGVSAGINVKALWACIRHFDGTIRLSIANRLAAQSS